MPETLRQLAGAGIANNEDLPPMYVLKFSEQEFPEFIANPVKIMKELGHTVEKLNISLSNSTWISPDKKWVKNVDIVKADLPTSQSWQWLCGYEDEMCVCHRVLMF